MLTLRLHTECPFTLLMLNHLTPTEMVAMSPHEFDRAVRPALLASHPDKVLGTEAKATATRRFQRLQDVREFWKKTSDGTRWALATKWLGTNDATVRTSAHGKMVPGQVMMLNAVGQALSQRARAPTRSASGATSSRHITAVVRFQSAVGVQVCRNALHRRNALESVKAQMPEATKEEREAARARLQRDIVVQRVVTRLRRTLSTTQALGKRSAVRRSAHQWMRAAGHRCRIRQELAQKATAGVAARTANRDPAWQTAGKAAWCDYRRRQEEDDRALFAQKDPVHTRCRHSQARRAKMRAAELQRKARERAARPALAPSLAMPTPQRSAAEEAALQSRRSCGRRCRNERRKCERIGASSKRC